MLLALLVGVIRFVLGVVRWGSVPEYAGSVLTLRMNGVLWFASAPLVEEQFNVALAVHPEMEGLVLDIGGLGRIDYTGALASRAVSQNARDAGLRVRVRARSLSRESVRIFGRR